MKRHNDAAQPLPRKNTPRIGVYRGAGCLKRLGLAAAAYLIYSSAWGARLDQLQQLIEDKHYDSAYELAKTLNAESAGQAQFDYFYGLAALETGHTSQAVFALERVLMVEPDNNAARLALARAYARTGQLDLAHALLNAILASETQSDLLTQARAQLAALPSSVRAGSMRRSAALSLSMGYDSNINATTDLEQLPPPPATILNLSPGARALDDGFARVGFGLNAERTLDSGGFVFGAVDGYENVNFHEHDFNTTQGAFTGGGGLDAKAGRLLLYATHQRLLLDHASYLSLTAPGVEWQWRLATDRQLVLSALYAGYRYDNFSERNTDALVIAGGWRQTLAWNGAPRFSMFLSYGDENARADVFEYYGRKYYGLEFKTSFNVAARNTPYLRLRWQTSDYNGLDLLYGVTRTDNYWRTSFGWTYRLSAQSDIGFEFEHTRNNSDIQIYSFERSRAFVTTRYEWQ